MMIVNRKLDYDHQFTPNFGLYVALSGRFLSAVDVAEYTSTQLDEMTNQWMELSEELECQ